MSGESRWWAALHEYQHTRFWRPFKLRRLKREAAAAMTISLADNRRRYPETFEYMRRWREDHAA